MIVEELEAVPPHTDIIYIDDAGREKTGAFLRYEPHLAACKLHITGDRGLEAHYVKPEDIKRVKG